VQPESKQARMADFVRANQAKVLDRWNELVQAAVGSRILAQ